VFIITSYNTIMRCSLSTNSIFFLRFWKIQLVKRSLGGLDQSEWSGQPESNLSKTLKSYYNLFTLLTMNLDSCIGKIIKHSFSLQGTISYVSQTAWIQNATFKHNILFQDALVETRYKRIVDACALRQDLQHLPFGDETEIGENVHME